MTAAEKKGRKRGRMKGQPDSCWLASHLCKVGDGLQALQVVWPAISLFLWVGLGKDRVAKCLSAFFKPLKTIHSWNPQDKYLAQDTAPLPVTVTVSRLTKELSQDLAACN